MSGYLNQVQLIGNLGADPEIRRKQDGSPIANLRIATSESWRDRNTGEKKERTEWHTVVIFTEGLAKVAEQYLKKGMSVFVQGQLATRKWQDQSGNDRWSTEIILQGFNCQLVMLGSPSGNRPPAAGSPEDYGQERSRETGQRAQSTGSFSRDLDDDIPF